MLGAKSRGKGGRPPGSPNRSTVEIKEIVRRYADFPAIIRAGAKKARAGNDRWAKLLFEYGYGKPTETVMHGIDGGTTKRIMSILGESVVRSPYPGGIKPESGDMVE